MKLNVRKVRKVKRQRGKIDISQYALLNMTVKAITALETSLHWLSMHMCIHQ